MAHILLVQDDHADVQMLLESFTDNKLLNPVVVINDGEQAMRYLRREGPHVTAPRPDLVLLDLRLPRLDGSGVLRAIRRDPALAGLVVAVLGRADLEGALLQQQGLAADAYLDRPVRFEDVVRLVRQVQHLELMFVRVSGSAPRS